MHEAFGERVWLGLTLGHSRDVAKQVLRLYKQAFDGKLHYPGGYGMLDLPERGGSLLAGWNGQTVDFIGVRRPLADKSLYDQVIDSLWSAASPFKPLRCGAWEEDRQNWQVLRGGSIVGDEGIDVRIDYWAGSAAGAEKNPSLLCLNWVNVATATEWREELKAAIANATIDLEHAGLPSVKPREGLLPVYQTMKDLLKKYGYEKSSHALDFS